LSPSRMSIARTKLPLALLVPLMDEGAEKAQVLLLGLIQPGLPDQVVHYRMRSR
jgi:hypothetical protein